MNGTIFPAFKVNGPHFVQHRFETNAQALRFTRFVGMLERLVENPIVSDAQIGRFVRRYYDGTINGTY